MGKIQTSRGKPIKLSTTFLVLFTQSFITARNWLRRLFPWDGKGMEVKKFELGRAPIFGKTCFGLMGKEEPKIVLLTHYAFTSSLPHAFLGALGRFSSSILHSCWDFMKLKLPLFYPSHAQLFSSFFMSRKSIFGLLRQWPVGIYDFGVYSSHFCVCNAHNHC